MENKKTISVILSDKIYKKFKEFFNEEPFLFRSPGRVNLMGEHIDYNNGFVLPAAIDKIIYFAVSPRSDPQFYNPKIFSYFIFIAVIIDD